MLTPFSLVRMISGREFSDVADFAADFSFFSKHGEYKVLDAMSD